MPPALAPAQAAAAYRAVQAPEAAPSGEGFGAALERAVQGAVELGHGADASATQALLGQGSVTDVVLAAQRAELALQTAVAVRDRFVSAYQEIMRMPI
ncbi:MAG TPA: flagellar hook-basal body complex protein FliE [Crenalkalicoccus sp.]|nr:flagellar hook-basal body complex protein FliE [Crenalkalicoccus sp.]